LINAAVGYGATVGDEEQLAHEMQEILAALIEGDSHE
jgi:hypothetical protein